MANSLTYKPLSSHTWAAFEELMGPRGGCGGCWCMTWRLLKIDYNRQKGEANKNMMKGLGQSNQPIGVLAFDGDNAVGWCAVAPRAAYRALENSRSLKRLDNNEVWSISCFLMKKQFRRKGLTLPLLKEALSFAESYGAEIVEGYPADTKGKIQADVFVWTGILSTFLKAGFKEMPRNSPSRPIVRYYIN